MKQAQFRFHAELNDFLAPKVKGATITCPINGDQSVKHLIESLGIPHPEVSRILVNEIPVDFGYIVQDADQIDVYPITPAEQIARLPNERCFILDNHLGRLAVYLRMLGFDSLYRNDYHDEELALVANQEERILLTRDVRLLMRNLVGNGYWVRSKIPREQLVEVVERFGLTPHVQPFRRCMRCNGILQSVSKERVLERLEPLTKLYYHEFRICPRCDRVYWKGSHYERMQKFLDQVIAESTHHL
jgi:uncharacterized protein with PIN domain/sulfur carrier protein ThiS